MTASSDTLRSLPLQLPPQPISSGPPGPHWSVTCTKSNCIELRIRVQYSWSQADAKTHCGTLKAKGMEWRDNLTVEPLCIMDLIYSLWQTIKMRTRTQCRHTHARKPVLTQRAHIIVYSAVHHILAARAAEKRAGLSLNIPVTE
ncbi:hypothetical protein Q8A73_016180 [Channa argus]|nr:hypothetical protein Q8A73_016180 [Channa argus]